MNNFLTFIEEDVSTKKKLISTMPTRTKTNIKKVNQKIDSIMNSYSDYKVHVKKYILTKSKSFEINVSKKDVEEVTKEVAKLEHVRFLLNPTNSYFEKMGFDNLLFDIRNYSDFNFIKLNETINNFLDKFELAGIKLTIKDFDCTYYVREYMTAFLDVRNLNTGNNDLLSAIFEKIYWENPEIVEHIEINFRKIIKKNKKKFDNYITTLQKEVMWKTNITTYQECLDKLKLAYNDLEQINRENINDIINMAKSGEIEIKNYFKDSKIRKLNYETIMIETQDLENTELNKKIHNRLEKLKISIEEYQNLLKFIPLLSDFKNDYSKEINELHKNQNKSGTGSNLKIIGAKISDKESKLEKLNNKIFTGDSGFFELKNNSSIKQQKVDSIILAKEIYNLYSEYDQEMFNEKILETVNNFVTIPELLHLYYSYDFFKKTAIQKVFKLTSYNDIIKLSESFDLFAMNSNNMIINGVSVFENNTISKIIVNKYRMDNINVSEENLEPDNLNNLLSKINFLIRSNEIEKSETTAEKIWFMAEVNRILELEKK
ncbi:MAG: hypothetical protein PHW32_03640 [Bacilli bacterium]|nr:hypothetical protein [Bacilli bacterium]MDD4282899.1 hypothetical protein [Bacilli bacterium]MDD4718692.1 hypothetical protein [Bacilli bacterium]